MGDKIDLFDGIDFDEISTSEKSPKKTYTKPPVNDEYDDPDKFEYDDYENLDDQKTKEQIRKLQIENEKALGNLVEKDLVIAILAEIGHQIQTAFIDLPRREAPNLAAELGIPNLERDLEKKWSDLNKLAIESVQNNVEKLSQDGVFE